ncbi:MAG: hypothetical protein QM767_21130 [Anaeromyxobacter sp.]
MATTGTPGRPSGEELSRAIDALVDEWRERSLWYLRRDWYPRTSAEQRSALEAIQRRSNLETFKRAARLMAWLSPDSSATSAGS